MKRAYSPLFLALLVTAGSAGCEKSSDLDAMQKEANGLVVTYRARFAALQQRMEQLDKRGRQLPKLDPANPEVQAVQRTFGEATSELRKLQDLAKQAPQSITAAANSEAGRAELIRLRGEIEERFIEGTTLVTADLDAVESWLTQVEWRGGQVIAAAAPSAQDTEAKTPPPAMETKTPEHPALDTATPPTPPPPPPGAATGNDIGSGAKPATPPTPPAGAGSATTGTDAGSATKPTKPAKEPKPVKKPAAGSGSGSATR